MLTDQQKEERRTGIGGSDVAAVCGLSPWRTALDVFLEKTGDVAPIDETPAMYWGKRLEDVVADEYARREGVDLRRVNRTLRAKDHPFMLAHIDRQVLDGARILECKTARDSQDWGEEGTDDVPIFYLTQCLHYMIVSGRDVCDLAVLFLLERDFRIYRIGFDRDTADRVIDLEADFWQRVEEGNPPPPVNTADTRKLFPQHVDSEIEATPSVLAAIDRLREIDSEARELEAEREARRLEVQIHMGDNAGLYDPTGLPIATWKTQTARRFDSKTFREEHPDLYEDYRSPQTSRVFRLKKAG